MIKTVLELDLVGYSTVARALEESMGPSAVATLNQKIQDFVDTGLKALKLARGQIVFSTSGDSAILLFDNADLAHRFAEAFHVATRDYNKDKTVDSAKRWFRMGAATGDVDIQDGKKIAGLTIANAVRLEAASRPGEFLIDVPTFQGLAPTQKKKYGAEETVEGKRDEMFLARRRVIVAEAAPATPAPAASPIAMPTGNRKAILELMDSLYPDDRLDRLMFMVEMPIPDRPSSSQTLSARRAQVVTWCESPAGPGLPRLEEELRRLVQDRP